MAARTHDLPALLARLVPPDSTLKALRRGLASLTRFAVDVRYPGASVSARQARMAIRLAERVQPVIRMRLGI